MLAVLALLFSFQTDMPKTFEQLQLAEIKDVLKLKTANLKLKLEENVGEQTLTARSNMTYKGNRSREDYSYNGRLMMETVADGKTFWVVRPIDKTYLEMAQAADPNSSDDPSSYIENAEPSTFSLSLGYPLLFTIKSDPSPVLQKIEFVSESGKQFRKATILCTSHSGKKEAITEWILPDRWIVTKAAVAGDVASATYELDMSALQLEPADASFKLDRSLLSGCRKVSLKDIGFVPNLPH